MSSTTSSFLKFTPLRNGDSNVFPGHARHITLLDGLPELIHIRKYSDSNDQNPLFAMATFKNGRDTTIFDFKSPDNEGWNYWSSGKTVCVWGNTTTAIFVTHKNRSFKAEKAMVPKDLYMFMRSNGTNYFATGSWKTEFKLFSSATDGILLRWRRPDCKAQLLRMVGADFVLCHMFEERTLVCTHHLQGDVFVVKHDVSVPFRSHESANLGDHHIVLVGLAELAVVDCRNGDVSMWSCTKFTDEIRECAARFDGNSAHVFVSTQSKDTDRTTLIHFAKFKFEEINEAESKDSDQVVEFLRKQVANLTTSNKEIKRELDDVRSDNEVIHSKLAKLEKVLVKLVVRSTSTESSSPQIHDSDSIRSTDSSDQVPAAP